MNANVTYAALGKIAKSMADFMEQIISNRRKGSVNDELRSLHDHLLDDIGLTRHQVDEMERRQNIMSMAGLSLREIMLGR